jgi:hypothetical protein
MKMFLKVLLSAAALGAVASPAFAQASAGSSTTGTTRILQGISIAKTTDLAFGTIVRPSTSTNSVVINETTGARTVTGGGDAVLVTSTSSRAAYTVTGEGAQTFSVTVPATFNTLVVTTTNTGATGTLSGTIGASGTATVGVGGSFPLATSTATGNYTGTFTTTVAYN